MSRMISVEVDVDLDHPRIQAAIAREVETACGDTCSFDEDEIGVQIEDVLKVQGNLEDARRYLCSPTPAPSEALIYIERALVTVAGMK